jgi:hypothetical protein
VGKQILSAVIRRDEAKTLCVVEPLYSTGCHLVIFLEVMHFGGDQAVHRME